MSFATFDDAILYARDFKTFQVTRVDPGESQPTPIVPYESKGRLFKHKYHGAGNKTSTPASAEAKIYVDWLKKTYLENTL